MKWLKENSLALAFLIMFLLALGGQAVAGMLQYNDQQLAQGAEPVSMAAEVSSDTACWRVLTPPDTCRCRGCWFASTPLPRPTGVRLSAALWLGPDGRSRCRSRGWCCRR
ncbi:DUF6766 family protein [Nonomuraea rosea]|uniref:DUF6766 family protein n=1 Tax=Nonomuraea rosea TaxID=638574 RepID=UPI0031E4F3A8